ncbi:MAG: Fe-S-containing hydro-lyase [Victivallaceae bacterium]|nr:Fe-S-containing hydro-lyase [Victivallaceae bacterium]
MTRQITLPLDEKTARALRAGDRVEVSGTIWTARDAAHARFFELLDAGKTLPVDLRDQTIYFVGPCPAPPGKVIGSAGPTTSGRMDRYSPRLITECGLRGMIGKGDRNAEVVSAMKRCGAVYFAATGGAGALIARCIKSCEVVAFPDLGPEAVHKLEVEKFPLIVAIDASGKSCYAREVDK